MIQNTKMQQRAEINKIFREKIVPILRNYEVYREKAYEQHVICTFIIAVILLFCIGFTAIYEKIEPENPWVMCITAIMIATSVHYTIYMYVKNKDFKLTLKRDCLEKVLNVFGNIKWKAKFDWLSDADLNESGLFIRFNSKDTDDAFKGSYRGINYKISEIELLDARGTVGFIKVFKGIVIRFKCNKTIKNRTVVATKGNMTQKNAAVMSAIVGAMSCLQFFKIGFSWFGVIMTCIITFATYLFAKNRNKKEEPLNAVTLEDTKFSKRFNVYSSDQVEARYLVTPSFMERLYNLQTSFGAKTIKCSFYKDYLMIAISTKQDLFELGDLFHPLLETNSHIKLFRDLYSILNMVEYFKLDEKVGL